YYLIGYFFFQTEDDIRDIHVTGVQTCALPIYKNGVKLFNAVYDPQKWERAAIACKEAIEACHAAGHQLYRYSLDARSSLVSTDTYYKMNIRGSVTALENPEVIWADGGSSTSTRQRYAPAPR